MDPVTIALSVVQNVVKSAERATSNQDNCSLLATLAGQTVPMLQQLEDRPLDDPIVLRALELLTDALQQAQKAVEVCGTCTYFVGMVYASKHSQMLREAATKLEFALDQLPVAAIGLTAEMHNCLFSLKDDLRKARFHERASAANQATLLKEEMEKAFLDNRKGTENMKCMIQEMLQEYSQKTEEKLKDLEILKQYAVEAQKAKDAREEYELKQIMDVIAESLKDTTTPDLSIQSLDEHLLCPISKTTMKDPVVLKDSGMTYDRSSIVEWMQRGYRRDPVTQTEIKSGDLIPNLAIRGLCQLVLHQSETELSSAPKPEASLARLIPGIYEGQGKERDGSGALRFVSLVLILEPDGNIQGYTIRESNDTDLPDHHLFVFRGEWQEDLNYIKYIDDSFLNKGTICLHRQSPITAFSLDSKSYKHGEEALEELAISIHHPHITPLPLVWHLMMMPGLLEMEGQIEAANRSKLSNKLVLLLKDDFSLRGWMSIEPPMAGKNTYGHVMRGTWNEAGDISFSLCFPKLVDNSTDSTEPLALDATKFIARYKLVGEVGQKTIGDGPRLSEFSGVCRRMAAEADPDTAFLDPLSGIGLSSSGGFIYRQFRKPSRNPSKFHRQKMQLLRLPSEPGKP